MQIYEQTSEKYQACLNIFQSECSISYTKSEDNNKRAMLCKRNSQLSEHNTNLFDVIQRANENSTELMGENLFSHATSAAKLRIKQISSLLEYFSQRVRMYVH